MKIFKFNPETGRRGEEIDWRPRCSWTACSLHYLATETISDEDLIDEIRRVKLPKRSGETWTAHLDAGVSGKNNKNYSYLTDEWICMCTGEWNGGVGWNWVVLPPKEFAERVLKSIPEEIGEEA